jgi:hypothetical protein
LRTGFRHEMKTLNALTIQNWIVVWMEERWKIQRFKWWIYPCFRTSQQFGMINLSLSALS